MVQNDYKVITSKSIMSQIDINFFLQDAMSYHLPGVNFEKTETILTQTELL